MRASEIARNIIDDDFRKYSNDTKNEISNKIYAYICIYLKYILLRERYKALL